MTTKRTTKTIEPTDDNAHYEELSLKDLEARTTLVNDVPDDDDISFQNLLNELGLNDDGGKVIVYKLEKGDYGKQTFLIQCTPAEFDMTMLQDPDYHLDGFHDFKIVLRNKMNIVKAKRVSAMPDKNFKRSSNIEVVAPSANNSNDILNAIMVMQANTEKLIAAMMTKPVEPQKTTMQMLQELAYMREVMGIGAQPAQPVHSIKDTLELAREIADMTNGDGGGGSGSLFRMLEKYAEPIMGAIASAQPAPAPIAQIQAPRINPLPAASKIPASPHGVNEVPNPANLVPINNNPPITAEGNEMNFMLKMYLKTLVNQAARDADVDLYADLVLDQVGDDIFTHIEKPTWFDDLKAIEPDVEPHFDWFSRLRASLMTPSNDGDELTDIENTGINEAGLLIDNLPRESFNTDDINT